MQRKPARNLPTSERAEDRRRYRQTRRNPLRKQDYFLPGSAVSGAEGAKIFCITIAHEASPVTDITVRPMSMIRSMPAATATHSTGMPADANTMAINAKLPPGMPGVPMDAIVEAKAMAIYWLILMSMPQQVAINTDATPR